MLTLEDHHLIMLMEECDEASQRASKQLRFGRDEVQPGQELPNHRRLRDEILDVLAVVGRLQEANLIEPITHRDVMEHRKAKQAKVDRMMELSRAQGRLAPETGNVCSDCPPVGYPTDETRCAECPRMETSPVRTEKCFTDCGDSCQCERYPPAYCNTCNNTTDQCVCPTANR